MTREGGSRGSELETRRTLITIEFRLRNQPPSFQSSTLPPFQLSTLRLFLHVSRQTWYDHIMPIAACPSGGGGRCQVFRANAVSYQGAVLS